MGGAAVAAGLAGLATWGSIAVAHGQACCAGASAVTPGRLAIHDDALVGIAARATDGYGSYDPTGTFVTMPAGTSEVDLEQDLFAALRLTPHAQAAVLVPIVETRRAVPGQAGLGGGVGDVNVAARYDFLYASEARYVPGIAVLAGVTVPTGTPPEAANAALATNATGIGAYQGNLGVAVEKAIGPWLVGATGLVAKRATRTADGISEALAPQWSALAMVAYTLPNEASLAISGALTSEGAATIDGSAAMDTNRRLVAVTLSGAWPVSDRLRVIGAVTVDPPVSTFGENQPVAGVGATATVIWAWL